MHDDKFWQPRCTSKGSGGRRDLPPATVASPCATAISPDGSCRGCGRHSYRCWRECPSHSKVSVPRERAESDHRLDSGLWWRVQDRLIGSEPWRGEFLVRLDVPGLRDAGGHRARPVRDASFRRGGSMNRPAFLRRPHETPGCSHNTNHHGSGGRDASHDEWRASRHQLERRHRTCQHALAAHIMRRRGGTAVPGDATCELAGDAIEHSTEAT